MRAAYQLRKSMVVLTCFDVLDLYASGQRTVPNDGPKQEGVTCTACLLFVVNTEPLTALAGMNQ